MGRGGGVWRGIGRDEGILYLLSVGYSADLGLQLGKACPCSKKGLSGNVVIASVPLLSFISLFLPYPCLSSPLLSLFCLLWEKTQNEPRGLMCR